MFLSLFKFYEILQFPISFILKFENNRRREKGLYHRKNKAQFSALSFIISGHDLYMYKTSICN